MNKQKQKNKQLTNQTNPDHKEQLTFLEHLYELRNRVFWVLLALILASAIGFQYKDQLIDIVMAPLNGEKLIYLTPGGGFSFIFTLAIYFGLLLTIPIIVFHLYKFIQPLIHNTSRRLVAIFMLLSCLLAAIGATFGYFVAVPAALNFLTTFAGDAVSPNLTAESYLGFVVSYLLGLAALFQLPLLLFMFDYVKPFKPGFLTSSQRYVVVGACFAAAIITPTPDVVNMAIIAVPVVVAYELGAIAVYTRRRILAHAIKAIKQPILVMPETPNEILTAFVERERPAAQGGLTVPQPEATPRHEQPAVDGFGQGTHHHNKPQPVVARIRPVATKGSIDGFGGPARTITHATVAARVTSNATQPAQKVRSLDGFTAPSRQPQQPNRLVPNTSAMRPMRSIDGFSTA